MDLPTYTSIWRIERRLYKLYDFRLPAPLPITRIGVFVGITVPYVVFLFAIGVPFNHTVVWLYVLPPGVVTWLTTRPVIEGKRLPELVTSQVRYISEPRAWCRMAPFAEKDEIQLSARVWRRHPPPARAKKAPTRALAAAAAPQAARTDVAEGKLAPAVSPVVPSDARIRVQARASARPASTPAEAASRVRPAWSPWPGGSAPEPGTPVKPAWSPWPGGSAPEPGTPVKPAWSPWPGGSAPKPGTPEPANAPGPDPRPTRSISRLEPIIVTLGQLYSIRARWRELAPAAAALRELGFAGQGEQVADIAYALGVTPFAVNIPCVTCRSPTPVDVGIGDSGNPEPGDALCGTCSAQAGEPDRDRARPQLARPHRIVVVGCSRGAGQTLTVLMTGHVLALLLGTAVAAVDLNAGVTPLAADDTSAVSVREVLAGRKLGERASRSGAMLQVVGELPDDDGSQLSCDDYQRLADLLTTWYPLTMIDPAPGSLNQVLPAADQLVVVVPARPDAAMSLASTQQWLGANGYGELASRAVTVVNGVSQRTIQNVLQAESVARGQCRAIVRIPWDDLLYARPVPPPVSHPQRALNPQTRTAYATLADVLVAALAAAPASTSVGRNARGR